MNLSFKTASSDLVEIATGSVRWVLQSPVNGLTVGVGTRLIATADTNSQVTMRGSVTSLEGQALLVLVDTVSGTGKYRGWSFTFEDPATGSGSSSGGTAGPAGPAGPAGTNGTNGATGVAGATGATGATGAAGAAGGALSITATEDLAAYSVVTSTGKVANSATLGLIGKIVGINPATILNTFSGSVTQVGEVQNLLWAWTAGDRLYLNGISLSTTAPASGFSQFIGTAKNSTTIIVELGDPVLL